MGHIFRDDGRTLIVAMDHSLGMGPVPGLEDAGQVLKKVIAGGADAVLVSHGIIKQYTKVLAGKIGVIWTIMGSDPKYIKQAAQLGVDAVKMTFFVKDIGFETFQQIMVIEPMAVACEQWGIPLLVELVPEANERVKVAARVSAELGGDFVKTRYPGSVDMFKEVVQTCPAPVVVLGGEKMDTDKDVLQMVKDAITAGGAGIAFGRNVWTHKNPTGITKALSKIIHDEASVEDALKALK